MTTEEDVSVMCDRLLEDFRARGVRIAGDLSVPEAAAEAALGLGRGTLRKRFALGTLRLPYRTESNRRWYAVASLARTLVARENAGKL
jgi:hypothetical protein